MIEINKIWYEKYRPTTLDQMILSDDLRKTFEEYKENGEIPHLLFCGPPGRGKTSLAKIIVNDMLDCQYLYINASDENGIDTIRSKVSNFAQTKSIDGKIKIIILDEADFLSASSQAALRNVIETFSDTCRFILTANLKHKVTAALRSRCILHDISATLKGAALYCFNILQKEGIETTPESKKAIANIIKTHFPDLRTTLNALQSACIGGVFSENQTAVSEEFFRGIVDIIEESALTARRFIIENEAAFNSDYPFLLKGMLDCIYTSDISDYKKQCSAILIAEHLYRSAFVVDQEINCFSCICQLKQTLNEKN